MAWAGAPKGTARARAAQQPNRPGGAGSDPMTKGSVTQENGYAEEGCHESQNGHEGDAIVAGSGFSTG